MKKILCFFILTLGIIGCSSDEDKIVDSFGKMNTNTTESLTDISFINKNQGIICGSIGFLAKTNDGGKTWTKLNVGDTQTFLSACMLNEQNFYTARLDMFATSNSGTTFNKIESLQIGSSIFSIKFYSPDKGLIIRGGSILKSDDSGKNWTEKYSSSSVDDLEITSPLVSYAYGGYTSDYSDVGVIVKTIDGGETWTKTLNSNSNIYSISFISDNIGYYINFKRELYKTINGSNSWIKISDLPKSPMSVCFINENVGYISTYEGQILETKDAGLNWKIVYNKTTEPLVKIITKDNAVFAIGNNGLFLKKK
ncbi:Uncharacterized protein SAMN05444397_1067 [Flavobacterium aquidurense]|uniref:Photosynthesis system II assembly factor Ycf48/Hcf136-like domain-containing protein n=1 Tax=Flavobacterium frigidimaris TaxID=262320 RepID=A0ABX4BJ54_FLAFR|nr:YCF48-related protein [Flavobacterium frigidimaris]OXA74903.1 hypothetical protein B0A65_22875 [Flavobacterium frigidimaris]SDZ38024.1 Uncharacterized protein SAMN05444397_1067 [Flavobacterium aquidurense]